MSDIHRGIIHRRKWRSHDTHLRLTAEEQKTGSSQRISFPALRLDEMESSQKKYLKQGTKVVVTGRIQTGSYTNRDGQKVYTTDVIVEEQEFAESKKAAGQQDGNNGGYSDAGDGFMNIPDGIDEELPFN